MDLFRAYGSTSEIHFSSSRPNATVPIIDSISVPKGNTVISEGIIQRDEIQMLDFEQTTLKNEQRYDRERGRSRFCEDEQLLSIRNTLLLPASLEALYGMPHNETGGHCSYTSL